MTTSAFNFDEVIDRNATNSMARAGFREYLFGDAADEITLPCADSDVISMWVADMAFASAPAAIEGMRRRLEHPIFGYSALLDDDLFNVFAQWCDDRYSWRPERSHFVSAAGVVPALHDLVEQHLGLGEKALTLTPAYGYFKHACDHHDRELVTSGLVADEAGEFQIDFDDFEVKIADPSVRLFFLCHPHNPTGREWSEADLRRIAQACFDNNVVVVSDEIHCDLLRSELTHTPLAKLFPESDQIITAMSASKTFNLAGLGLAHVIIPNSKYRARWADRVAPIVNPVSASGVQGAFANGHAWLAELRAYLDANFVFVAETLKAELPDAVFRTPNATYLAWVGLATYVPADLNLTRFFAERTGVLVEGPDLFVADAESYIRINVACPRSVLEEGLGRIVEAVRSLGHT